LSVEVVVLVGDFRGDFCQGGSCLAWLKKHRFAEIPS